MWQIYFDKIEHDTNAWTKKHTIRKPETLNLKPQTFSNIRESLVPLNKPTPTPAPDRLIVAYVCLIVAYLSHKFCFDHKGKTWKQAWNSEYIVPRLPKSAQGAVPKSSPNKTKPSLDFRTTRSRFLSSQVPLDRSMVYQGDKVQATRMPGKVLGEVTRSAPQITANHTQCFMEPKSGHQRGNTSCQSGRGNKI